MANPIHRFSEKPWEVRHFGMDAEIQAMDGDFPFAAIAAQCRGWQSPIFLLECKACVAHFESRARQALHSSKVPVSDGLDLTALVSNPAAIEPFKISARANCCMAMPKKFSLWGRHKKAT